MTDMGDFVLVPREPTPEMRKAAAKAMSPTNRPTKEWVSCSEKHAIRYRAMIAAAPPAPITIENIKLPLPAWLGEDTPELRAKLMEFVRAAAEPEREAIASGSDMPLSTDPTPYSGDSIVWRVSQRETAALKEAT